MKLSANFDLKEFVYSATAVRRGIDNTPPTDAILEALKRTAAGLELIRTSLGGHPIKVTSGYRCPALNKAVGGAVASQHLKGEACDFVCPGFGTPLDIVKHLAEKLPELGIDQIIEEGTWVHVSFAQSPRHEVLRFKGGEYRRGLA